MTEYQEMCNKLSSSYNEKSLSSIALKFEPSPSSRRRLCVPSLILRMFKRLNFADDLQLNFLYEYRNSYDKVQ
jgi:hypothetical protein